MRELERYGVMPDEFNLLSIKSRDYFSNAKNKKILDSPWAFVDRYILGNKKEQTDAMRMGLLIHQALLEPAKFREKAIEMPKFTGKGSVAAKKEWLDEHKGMTIMSTKDMDTVTSMLDSLLSHQKASNILSEGKPEVKVMARDEQNNMNHLAMPDFLRDDSIFIDVKKCTDASREGFEKTFYNMNYYIQAAYYAYVLELVTGQVINETIYIMVEDKMPFNVGIYYVGESDLAIGKKVVHAGIQEYNKWRSVIDKAYELKDKKEDAAALKQFLRSHFPPINNGNIVKAGLPYWAINKIAEKYNLNMED